MKTFQFSIVLIAIYTIHSCLSHPIFSFDFFSSKSTTTESVISDYRNQKKTDSSFDHVKSLKNVTEDEPMYTENTAEFYAEIFGRLVGSVRSSFADLVADIRKRNQYFRDRSETPNKTNRTTEELQLEAIMKQLEESFEAAKNSTSTDEMQSKKSKRNPLIESNEKVGDQLVIPINLNTFYYDLISEEEYPSTSADDSHWLKKYFEQIKETHSNKKDKKIMNFFKLILTPVLQLNTTEQAEEEIFDNEIMFNIVQGNRTIGLTPFQILRILHKEGNDRIQLRMKLILKRIVYKYARLYYIARKNYKNSNGQNTNDNFRLLEDSVYENYSSNDIESLTNDGRHNFNSVEGVAILLLEIFGALFALTIGFWAQLEGGFFNDLFE